MEQRRFLLAMILSGLVIFVWQAFFVPAPEEPEDEEDVVAQQQQEVDPDPVDEPDPDPVDEPDPDELDEPDPEELAEAEAPDEVEEPDEVDDPEAIEEPDEVEEVEEPDIDERLDRLSTGFVDVVLTNRGAVVVDVSVTAPDQYARGTGGDMMHAFERGPSDPEGYDGDDLLKFIDEAHYAPDLPYSVQFEEGNIDIPEGAMFEVVEDESQLADDGETYDEILYRYTDPGGQFELDKSYAIGDDRYTVDLEVEFRNTIDDNFDLLGTPTIDVIGRDDPDEESSFFDFRPDVLEGVCHTTDDTEREDLGDAETRQTFSDYSVIWAGTDTRYFKMSAVPVDPAEACSIEAVDDTDYLRTRIHHPSVTIPSDGHWSMDYVLYMGPKDYDILGEVGHELENAVDYGLFSFLARPLRWSLARLYGLTGNWGLAIILLTLIIKLLTWRITGKAYTNAERMKQIQPKIKEIREKYENDQQRMTEETMKVFKENDVSPLGCLPLLLQMPILYGLFVMIYNSVELYQANFLWYTDLSAPDPWFILPIVMGSVMFIQQRITMSTTASTNPQMQIVMKVMPVAFTAFMLFLPAGLVLYYLLNLMMGLSQQFLIKRRFRQAEAAGEEI